MKIIRGALLLAVVTVAVSFVGYVVARLRSQVEAVSIEHVPENFKARPSGDGIKIGVYNIAHGRGSRFGASNWDGGGKAKKRARLEKIGALAAQLGLDVLVLNEVDFSAVWSGHVDQSAIVAESGGFPYITRQRNLDVWTPFIRLRFGNAVLSRHQTTSAELVELEPLSKTEKILAGNHDAVLSRIAMPDGGTIAVLAVHLEVRSVEVRRAAARKIGGIVESSREPVIVAGDFNSAYIPRDQQPGERSAVSMLIDSGYFYPFPDLENLDRSGTFPSESPDRVIDWVLYPKSWRLVSGSVIRSELSDHLPVFVSIEPIP